MKKVIPFMLLVIILLSSACGSGARVGIRSRDDNEIIKELSLNLSDVTYKTSQSRYKTWFMVTESEFITAMDNLISDNYGNLIEKQRVGSYSVSYALAGKEVFKLNFHDNANGYIEKIDMYLNAQNANEAELFGEVIYRLIEAFTPNKAKLITDELYIFDSAPKDYPIERYLVAGNVVYNYSANKVVYPSFSISAAVSEDRSVNAVAPKI